MNQLTPENLDRIKRLQPLFKEKMEIGRLGMNMLNLMEIFILLPVVI